MRYPSRYRASHRRRAPRRTRSRRTYSLARLINRQPKTLSRHELYYTMMAHYHASPRLQSLRISRRCYSLLHNARIAPENLEAFYRTYRLPRNPFFPLFFTIKRSYLQRREEIREARRRYIRDRMRSLPPDTRSMIKYLGYLERHAHTAGESPLWQRELYPSSKKQVDRYLRCSRAEWLDLLRAHLQRLQNQYRVLTPVTIERVFASFVLGIVPREIPPRRPVAAEISRVYRKLSLLHHPDRGGDPVMFIRIKRARDVLVEKGEAETVGG